MSQNYFTPFVYATLKKRPTLTRRIINLMIIRILIYTGGLNHLPYLLSISVSMAVIKDFSTNDMKPLGLNQSYMLWKLRNSYFSMKLWRNLTKLYPMTIISSDHNNEILFFRNHVPQPFTFFFFFFYIHLQMFQNFYICKLIEKLGVLKLIGMSSVH